MSEWYKSKSKEQAKTRMCQPIPNNFPSVSDFSTFIFKLQQIQIANNRMYYKMFTVALFYMYNVPVPLYMKVVTLQKKMQNVH